MGDEKLNTAFMDALTQDFKRAGKAAIADLRERKPEAYVSLIAKLLPDAGASLPIETLDETALDAQIAALLKELEDAENQAKVAKKPARKAKAAKTAKPAKL